MQATDESHITEIELLPDGRLCLFGATSGILKFLEEIGLADDAVRRRLPPDGYAAGDASGDTATVHKMVKEPVE